MRRLRLFLFHDIGIKVLALIISFSLWTIYTSEPFAQIAYNVPVAYLNAPSGMVVSGVYAGNTPATVRVTVRGRSGLLRRLSPADLILTVDLSGTQAGDVPVKLKTDMVHVPYGTEVVRIAPSQYSVTLVPTKEHLPGAE